MAHLYRNLLVIFVSSFYFLHAQARHIDNNKHRKQRHSPSDDNTYVDLSLSYNTQNNNIEVTTEEPNIWWPWASYEEWKKANHMEQHFGNKNIFLTTEQTTSTLETTQREDNNKRQKRKQHKRSKKNDEQRQQRKKRRQEEKRKLREERKREREKNARRNRNKKKWKQVRLGPQGDDNIHLDDGDMENALWEFLNSRNVHFQNDWDYLNDEADSECSNEIQYCKPKCMIFTRSNSYMCTCPRHHELIIQENRCRRKQEQNIY